MLRPTRAPLANNETKLNSNDLRVILIGGTSHVGKSALAKALSAKLGWRYLSTDSLARHPGRPWASPPRCVPAHVAAHYLSMSTDDLMSDVLNHYRKLWPEIEDLVTRHAANPGADRLVLEGSALWPEFVAIPDVGRVAAVWLTARPDLFRARIHADSRYEEADDRQKAMIAKFLARTLCYDRRMTHAVVRLGRACVDVEQAASVDELSAIVIEHIERSAG